MANSGVRPLILDFAADASLDDVLNAVKIAYDRSGCSPCGRLSGMIRAIDQPDPAQEFRSVRSLRSAVELDAFS